MAVVGKYVSDRFWGTPVATAADLPADAKPGEARVTLDTGAIYVYDGSAWGVAPATPVGSQLTEGSIIVGDASDLAAAVDTVAQGDVEAGATGLIVKDGLDATKIADGTVSNTEFQYIGGLTSDAQGQLDAKADVSVDAVDFAITSAVDRDTIEFDNVSGNWVNVPSYPAVTNEPNGFENRTDSTISFVSGTRTFTIAPTGTDFNFWVKGERAVVSTPDSLVIPAVTGANYIYYDIAGNLLQSTSFPDVTQVAIVAIVYWNNTTGHYLFQDERHGVTMDGVTHNYLHLTHGAAYASGGAISVVGTLGNELLADNQFSITETVYYDEDIRHVLAAITGGTHTWEKWYIDSAGNWRRLIGDNNENGSNATTPTFCTAGGLLGFNNIATGTIDAVAGSDYVNVYIFGTNTAEAATRQNQFITLCGQAQHANTGTAFAETVDSLQFGQLPSPELVPLYQITFQEQAAGAGEVGFEIERILDIRSTRAPGVAAGSASAHNSLSGLQGGTAGEYYHLTAAEDANLTGGAPTFATSVTTPKVQAVDTAGLILANNSGTTCLTLGLGGGSNVNATFADGVNVTGVFDQAGAATLSIGTGNATAITMGKIGVTTTFPGSVSGVAADFSGNVDALNLSVDATTGTIRIGPDENNSWRLCIVSGNLVIQKKESGTWVTKSEIV